MAATINSPVKIVGTAISVGIPLFIYEYQSTNYVNAKPLLELAGDFDRFQTKRKMLLPQNQQLFGFIEFENVPESQDNIDHDFNLYLRLDRIGIFILRINTERLIEKGNEHLANKILNAQIEAANLINKELELNNAKNIMAEFFKNMRPRNHRGHTPANQFFGVDLGKEMRFGDSRNEWPFSFQP